MIFIFLFAKSNKMYYFRKETVYKLDTYKKMKIIIRKISELHEADYNPRKLDKKQEDDLKKSLEEFGIVDPIIVNTNPRRKNIIVGGHQRLKVWASLGNKTIPTVEVDLTLEKEKELNVRLNKNTGEFDFDMLQSNFDFDDLFQWGFEPEELPIDISEIKEIAESDEDEFVKEFNKTNDDNCKYPIVPVFFEKHECFLIPIHNEIDEGFIRDIFGLNENHVTSFGEKNIRKTNVISVDKIKEWIAKS